MNKLIYKGAINSLSFGNVSYNMLKELHKRNMEVAFFPIGENLIFDAFDLMSDDLKNWIILSSQNRIHLADKETPTLHQWHLNGSENRVSKNQTLFTFYETDSPTETERSLVNLQDTCVFGSSHAAEAFKKSGCDNVDYVPIGFDSDFHETDDNYMPDKIHFGLMGKFENRKNSSQILKNWAKKYGNNYKYQLTCCISNPFLKPEQLTQLINQSLGGVSYGNINFLPHLKTNSEVNDFINAIDIDISGLSGAEGWNIPAFNATALGKWSVVMNHTSHKDWANSKNSILIEPEQSVEIYDQMFFKKDGIFNQGNMNKISDEKMIESFEKAEKKSKEKNKEGLKLQKDFTYSNTIDKILKIIQNENSK